jgi:hypothetical protein
VSHGTPNTKVRLEEHRWDVHSQFGEDGMIARALELLPASGKWCVELGAWDGRHLSNTHRLMCEEGWSGVFIEGATGRYDELCETYRGNERAFCINAFARFNGASTLDRLLASTPIPTDFELLSLDVDGTDYQVWESLKLYRPALVVVEFNATIPNDIDFVQAADPDVHHGSSLAAFVRLGAEKGYELVATSDFNAFFVRAVHYPAFGIEHNSIDAIHTNREFQTRVFQLLDGTLCWTGCTRLLWQDVDLRDGKRLQLIPRRFRYFPGTEPSERIRTWRLRYLWLLRRLLSRGV